MLSIYKVFYRDIYPSLFRYTPCQTGLLGLVYSDGVHGQRIGRRGRQQFRRGRQDAAPPANGYAGAEAPTDSYGAGAGEQAQYNDAGAIDNYAAASDASQATYNGDGAQSDAAGDELAALEANIPGIPGEDYPIFSEVPETEFLCDGQVDGGKLIDIIVKSIRYASSTQNV